MPIIPKVSCKDVDTLSKIHREKELLINKEVFEFLRKRYKNKLLSFLERGGEDALSDSSI